jgi:anti-sigma factor RsiW
MHLNDEQIQRLMHGELAASSQDAIARHAAECPACAQALAQARREEAAIFDLLEHVDHETPMVHAASFATPARPRSSTWTRWAAGIVVATALAGGAYAIPGSPLPELVKRLAALMTGERPEPPANGDVSTPAAPATSGIAVPAGERLLIEFASAQDSGAVTVSFTDDTLVRVRVLGGSAAFTTDAGRLEIANTGSSADYEIDIPRSAPWVEIRVVSASRLQKDGEKILSASPADAHGRHRLSLAAAK